MILFFNSDVKIYDPSGDSTLPSTSKKRKFEETQEEGEEPVTPVAKVKKPKKEPVTEGRQTSTSPLLRRSGEGI